MAIINSDIRPAPRRTGWKLGAGLFLAGAVAVAALPPLYLFPAFLVFAFLAWHFHRAERARDSFLVVWSFAFGYFLAGLYWVGIAFFADAERFGALAVPGVVGLAVVLSTINASILALFARLARRSVLASVLVLASAWPVTDLFRGAFGTQFPWNPPAIALAFSDSLYQLIAWVGVPGASFLTLLVPMVAGLSLAQHHWGRLAGVVALTAILFTVGHQRLDHLALGEDPILGLRLVQPAIAQHHKWDPELRRGWFMRHIELSNLPGRYDLLIWPESSVPYRLDDDETARRMVAGAIGGGRLAIVGADHVDFDSKPPILNNSVYVIDRNGIVRARYDKVNLVPFGEFLPFRSLLGRVGLDALAVGSIDFQPGAKRHTIEVEDVEPFSPLVCFEAVFPGRATDGSGRARWILNVTNDAWFGISSGPYQHLAMARMRSVESGLPLVRAANTGISVVTDAYGRVVGELGLGEMGVLDVTLPPALVVPPPVARWPLLAWLLPLLGLLAAIIVPRKDA